MGETKHVDVIVVGAGFAGMTAARELGRHGKQVAVLEARTRVGGRVKGGKIAGQSVDVGGQWVAPQQTKLLDLIERQGLHTTPQYLTGNGITQIEGHRWLAEGEGLPEEWPERDELVGHFAKLDQLALEIPAEAPWTAARAEEFDRMTLQEWLSANGKDQGVLGHFQAMVRSVFQAETWQMSFLYFLTFIRQAGTLENLSNIKDAAQALRVVEGLHGVAARLAVEIGPAIVLEAPVRSISQTPTGVTVRSDRGTWVADFCVVSVPLPLSVRIAYDPPLPAERDVLAQRMPMGSVIKFIVAYAKPFWRDRGLNGLAFTALPPLAYTYDGGPQAGAPGLLVGLIDTRFALQWTGRSTAERKQLVVDRLVDLFGEEAANPIDYEDANWPAEIWSRGCYGGSMGPGVLTTVGKYLREPHGRIHWAGTETAVRWTGYVEGAIDSGERAAASVLAAYSALR